MEKEEKIRQGVVDYFEVLSEISDLNFKKKELSEGITRDLVELLPTRPEMTRFFSVNWRALHKEFVRGRR